MNRVIVIDYSVIEKFADMTQWKDLFMAICPHDYVIFSYKNDVSLEHCKAFFAEKAQKDLLESIEQNFISQSLLVESLQSRFDKIKHKPEGNRFVFFGDFPTHVLDRIVSHYQILEDRLLHFGITYKGNNQECFGDNFFASLSNDEHNHFVSFDCSDKNFFMNFYQYIFNAVNKDEHYQRIIKNIKNCQEETLALNKIIDGPEGTYDSYQYSVEQMSEMMHVIPKSVKVLDLSACFNSLRSFCDQHIKKVLDSIPDTVQEFKISAPIRSDTLASKVAGEIFQKKEDQENTFLRHCKIVRKITRSQTYPAAERPMNLSADSSVRFLGRQPQEKDSENKRLQQENLKLKERLARLERENKELKENNESLEQEVDELRERLDETLGNYTPDKTKCGL